MSWKKTILLGVRIGLVALILFYIYKTIPMNPREIGLYLLHTGTLFYVSLALFTLFLALQAAIWLQILNDGKRQLSLRKGLYIYVSSQFAKYIPGGFWNYAGRVVMANREGVPMPVQMAAILYENVLLVLAAAVFTLYLLLDLHVLPYFSIGLVIVGLILAYVYFDQVARWASTAGGWVNRRLGRLRRLRKKGGPQASAASSSPAASAPGVPRVPLSRRSFFRFFGYYLISHMVMGVSFWLLIRSFHIYEVSLFYAAGTFAASWLLGLLSPLPGGIGVREGFLVYFLSMRMDAATALQISIIARIWNIFAEVLLYAILQALEFTRKKRMKSYET